MPFNAEEVARAVAACPVPVVTGIGHEPDTSIADMVADLRASTPTAAAEACTPAIEQLHTALSRERRALGRALENRLHQASSRVSRLAERPVLKDSRGVLGPAYQALDLASMRLQRAIPERLSRDRARVSHAAERLRLVAPHITEPSATAVALAAARLDDLSPLAILRRGYAAVFSEDGRTVVSSVVQVGAEDQLRIRLSDGHIRATVNGTDTLEER